MIINSPRKRHRYGHHTHRHPIAILQAEEVHHIAVEIPPVAHHRETVVAHARQSQRVCHAVNGRRAADLAVLFVVRLMEALQTREVVTAPRFAGDGARNCQRTYVHVVVERRQNRGPGGVDGDVEQLAVGFVESELWKNSLIRFKIIHMY